MDNDAASNGYGKKIRLQLLYHLARIASYLLIPALFFYLLHFLDFYSPLSFLRLLAGVLLIAMGLYLAELVMMFFDR